MPLANGRSTPNRLGPAMHDGPVRSATSSLSFFTTGTPEAKAVASDVAEGVSTSRSSERSLAFMITAKPRDSIIGSALPFQGASLRFWAL